MKFKKGDLVTKIGSWDRQGTIYVTHYIVSSWGKQQATLVKVGDLTNAKFRVYTDPQWVTCQQGIHSWTLIATKDYSEEVALQFARECIAEENRRAIARFERPANQGNAFEARLFAEHNATPWTPAVKVVT